MKIAVTASNNKGLESEVDSRFGRSPYFAIIDLNTMEFNFLNNSAVKESGGAGIKAAQMIADQKVDALITGNLGPKAFSALKATDLKLYNFDGGTIKKAVEAYKNGDLKHFTAPTNDAHSGLK